MENLTNLTNLSNLLEDMLLVKPVKATNLKPVKLKSTQNTEEVETLVQAWQQLALGIFVFFKARKGTANMSDLRTKFADKIQFINDNFDIKNVTYKVAGTYIRAYYGSYRIAQISTANAKLLPNDKGEGFVLWSILGHITCNGKTPLCASYCYNNSKSFNAHLQLKIDCLITSMLDMFGAIIGKMILFSPHQKTYVRIHEDGDFYDMEYFSKWMEIAKNNKGFVFEAYTKEPALLDQVEKINATKSNVVLRYSLMEDSNPAVVQYIKENNVHNYTAIGVKKKDPNAKKVFEFVPPVNRCAMSCQLCKKCYKKDVVTLITKLH